MKLPQKLNYNGLSMILLWQRKPPSSLQSDPVRKHKFLKNLLTEKGTKLPASGQLELSRYRSKMYEPLRSKTYYEEKRNVKTNRFKEKDRRKKLKPELLLKLICLSKG